MNAKESDKLLAAVGRLIVKNNNLEEQLELVKDWAKKEQYAHVVDWDSFPIELENKLNE